MAGLNKDQIIFIDENAGTMSARQISRRLGVDKKLVEEHLRKPQKPRRAPIAPWKVTAIHLSVIIAVALAIRLVYIHQLSGTYFFKPFKGGFDDYIFDNWALEILKGNWVGDKAIFIYRMPLYVYILAAIYFVSGHSYGTVYIFHAFIGAATCLLVYASGRMLANRTVGFLAAIITALYGPFLYFGGMVVGETAATFLTCLAFLFLLFLQKTEKPIYALLGGLSIGLSALLRGNMLIALPFILLWGAFFSAAAKPVKRILFAALIIAGVAAAIAPIMARNYIVTKDIVPVTAFGGLNLYIGNATRPDGRLSAVEDVGTNPEQMIINSVAIAEKAAGRELKPSEVSNYWVGRTLDSIKKRGAGHLAALTLNKLLTFFNSYEIPDIWDYYFFKRYIPLLNLPLTGFLLVMPFAAAGACLGWPRRRELSLLYVFVISYIISLVTFFISSRYRLGVVPFLSLFAAYAAYKLFRWRSEGTKRLAAACAVMVAVFLISAMPVKMVGYETSYNSLGIMLKRDGKFDDAIKAYDTAIGMAPRYPSPYYNLGLLYRDKGDAKKAAVYFRKALEADPGFDAARRELDNLNAGAN